MSNYHKITGDKVLRPKIKNREDGTERVVFSRIPIMLKKEYLAKQYAYRTAIEVTGINPEDENQLLDNEFSKEEIMQAFNKTVDYITAAYLEGYLLGYKRALIEIQNGKSIEIYKD